MIYCDNWKVKRKVQIKGKEKKRGGKREENVEEEWEGGRDQKKIYTITLESRRLLTLLSI